MLQFVKYHGLGNDFILVDGLSAPAPDIEPARGNPPVRPAFRRRRGRCDPGPALGRCRLPDATPQLGWL